MGGAVADVDTLHIAMYPWYAMGHLTPFLHISNKLAERGHRVSFFLPTKTQSKLNSNNLHPNLITFIPVVVPHVDGLPPGAETTADVPHSLHSLIMTAMDLTQPEIEASLRQLKPHIVFFDFAYWVPALARSLGIKSIHYCIISPVTIGYLLSPSRNNISDVDLYESSLMHPPPGFPAAAIKLHSNEARRLALVANIEYGKGITFYERQNIALSDCDALAFRACREIEGSYCDYLETQFRKPVLVSGSVVPVAPRDGLEERWVKWLGGFEANSVVYCAFGSECILSLDQFRELVMGLELTGLPFLAALKLPIGTDTIEAALPEGFEERVGGRGVVHGQWVQQQLILEHPSVGCFVTHCGSGSLMESLVNKCQVVLLPHIGDQILNARMMGGDLKVGVEVEKGGDGLFTRESVCKAVKMVMDEDSEIGREVKANHKKWRDFFLTEGIESSYIQNFVHGLQDLVQSSGSPQLNSNVNE
ncbi:PREDICTED: UDP-glycosyltransferase 79B30-like [Nelumbo nucifera]|uniref:Glycosyltransferase n=2 Tax=Nelumbo nucifera TaxID=4432 RepID=A0A1U8A742_NELNU|nr:PREDICTED: UDP-glycosyltransferase 79B30-like [Nelumbo nucifera]DAD23151.1 TPA_asm: hypothetical protein HUJ06_024614 [Nelumbo nucifera]